MSARATTRTAARAGDPRRRGLGDAEIARALAMTLDAERDAITPDMAARLAGARRHARRTLPADSDRFSYRRFAARRSRFGPAVVLASGLALAIGVLPRLPVETAPATLPGVVEMPPVAPIAAIGTPIGLFGQPGGPSDANEIEFYRSVDFLLWLERQRG